MSKFTKRKDGRYATRITLGVSELGKPICKYLYANTIRELEDKIALVKVNKKDYLPDSDVRLDEYSLRWLTVFKKNLGSGTYYMYESRVRNYIIKDLGHIKVAQLTKSHIQTFVNSHADKPPTIKAVVMILKQILNCAVEEGIISKNVVSNINFPRYESKRKRALTNEEVSAIFNADFDDMQYNLVMLLYYTGMRIGEALALDVKDIDYVNHTITVNKNLVRSKSDPKMCEVTFPKTKNSTRVIPFPAKMELRNLHGNKVFGIVTYAQKIDMWSGIKTKLKPLLGKVEISPHYFRHNYCTMLYYSGVSLLQAQKLMGHSDLNQIMKIYSHLDSEKENLDSKINSMFS